MPEDIAVTEEAKALLASARRLLSIFALATFFVGAAWGLSAWAGDVVGDETAELTSQSAWIIRGLLMLTSILTALLAWLMKRVLEQIDEGIKTFNVRFDRQATTMGEVGERLANIEGHLKASSPGKFSPPS